MFVHFLSAVVTRCQRRETNSYARGSPSEEQDRQLPQGLPFRSNIVFLHVDAIEASGGSSKKNHEEAECVAWLVELCARSRVSCGDIGVISPYGAQVL